MEFKRGLGDLSALGKAICAFTNTSGGVVVLVLLQLDITGYKL
ncbi:MAG: hypothetical protein OXI15_03145 [Chromatiales bacterium]|nr:hypothetical protein [Chromatiales bacterium]